MACNEPKCAFCGKGKSEDSKERIIIRSKVQPYKFICNYCVSDFKKVIAYDNENPPIPA